jgi:hypothetical protein
MQVQRRPQGCGWKATLRIHKRLPDSQPQLNMGTNRVRSPYKTTRAVTAYRDQEEGYADDPYPIEAGITIFAAIADDETRTLNGKPVKVVLFTLGTGGWLWLPRSEFLRSAVPNDVTTQTGTPFEH